MHKKQEAKPKPTQSKLDHFGLIKEEISDAKAAAASHCSKVRDCAVRRHSRLIQTETDWVVK